MCEEDDTSVCGWGRGEQWLRGGIVGDGRRHRCRLRLKANLPLASLLNCRLLPVSLPLLGLPLLLSCASPASDLPRSGVPPHPTFPAASWRSRLCSWLTSQCRMWKPCCGC